MREKGWYSAEVKDLQWNEARGYCEERKWEGGREGREGMISRIVEDKGPLFPVRRITLGPQEKEGMLMCLHSVGDEQGPPY